MKNKARTRPFVGMLPNGKHTTSVDRYVRAYRKLKNVMASIWPEDAKTQIGYEPGVQMGTISMSNRQAIQLYETITKKKYTC